jgi:hypothetical protein
MSCVLLALVFMTPLEPSPVCADEPGEALTRPVQVIVWTGGKWIEVETVEERNGSIIYRKPGGVPIAATEHSVDIAITNAVNGALTDLFDACSGRTADPRSMFELSGLPRQIFFHLADTNHSECFRRMHRQYREWQESHHLPPPVDGVSSYAKDTDLTSDSDGRIVLDNSAVGSAAGASLSAYRLSLETYERSVVQVESNVRAALDRMVLFQDTAWMTRNYAQLDALHSAGDAVRAVSPPPAAKVFHTMVVATVAEIDGIGAAIRKGFETGNPVLLQDALTEIDLSMERFDEHTAKAYETYRTTGQESVIFGIDDLYGNPDELIAAKCRTEWPDDIDMQTRCVEEQKKAFRRLRTRTNRTAGVWSYIFDDIREECRLEWPSDFVKRDTCEETRIDLHIAVHGRKTW